MVFFFIFLRIFFGCYKKSYTFALRIYSLSFFFKPWQCSVAKTHHCQVFFYVVLFFYQDYFVELKLIVKFAVYKCYIPPITYSLLTNMEIQKNQTLQNGKYRIIRFISAGGFGCTYEAEHVQLHRRVAIKEFFPKEYCNRNEVTNQVSVGTQSRIPLVNKLKNKFKEEAIALSEFKHPNIVSVFDVFEENGTAYYVMEYIDGKSVHEILKDKCSLSESVALDYIVQIANALDYVHGFNRLHLDVKPGNIVIDKNGKAILIDFGASKQYDEESGENFSTLMGKTPGYAPLELGNNIHTFTPATDIYSLGATLYKMLSGVTPPKANQRVADDDELSPLPSYISDSTKRAVFKAMAVKRKDRPQTISEFLRLLNVDTNSVEKNDSEETILGPNDYAHPNSIQAAFENSPVSDSSSNYTERDMLNEFYSEGGRFVKFSYSISILIMTFKRYSKTYAIKGDESVFKYGWPYFLISFVLGWWGFPWGPIYTFQSLYNAFNGHEVDPDSDDLEIVTSDKSQGGSERFWGLLCLVPLAFMVISIYNDVNRHSTQGGSEYLDTLQYIQDEQEDFLKKHPDAAYFDNVADTMPTRLTDGRIVFDCPDTFVWEALKDSTGEDVMYRLYCEAGGVGVITSGFAFDQDYSQDEVTTYAEIQLGDVINSLYNDVKSPKYTLTYSNNAVFYNDYKAIIRYYAIDWEGSDGGRDPEVLWRYVLMYSKTANKWMNVLINGVNDQQFNTLLESVRFE